MNPEELSIRFFGFRTDLERSLRYYAVMRTRCALWAFFVQLLCVVSTTSVFVAIVDGMSPTQKKWFASIVAVCSSLSLAERASNRANWYLQKSKSFSDLLGRVPLDKNAYTIAMLEDLTRERQKLEADEPPVYGCLSVLLHNEECVAVGRIEDIQPLSWWQRNVLRFFPVSYRKPKKRRCCLILALRWLSKMRKRRSS